MLQHYDQNIQFANDSFDEYLHEDYEVQNSQAPSAIPINQHNNELSKPKQRNGQYELTFKKQKPHYALNQNKKQIFSQNLFKSNFPNLNSINNIKQRRSIQHTDNSIHEDQYFINKIDKSKSLQQINEIILQQNFGKLLKEQQLKRIIETYDMNQICQIKITTLMQMVILKNLRKKRNSVKLNIQVIKIGMEENQLSEADKKRLQLLQLLNAQLDKKIFIQALRYNKMKTFLNKIMIDVCTQEQQENEFEHQGIQQSEDEHLFNNQFITNNLAKQKNAYHYQTADYKQIKSSPLKTSHTPTYVSPAKDNPYFMPRRLTIFHQILASIFNKVVYQAYKKIQQPKHKQIRTLKNSQRQRQPLKQYNNQQTNNNQQFHNQQSLHVFQNQENPQLYEKDKQQIVAEIYEHIRAIKRESVSFPKNNEQLLKNHFIKWKIYFLNKMALKVQQVDEMQLDSQRQRQRNNGYGQNKNVYFASQKEYESAKSVENDLKEEKHELKNYLKACWFNQFVTNLQQAKASKQIKAITNKYYADSIKRKAFNSLIMNRQSQINLKQIEMNANYFAENQDESQETAAALLYKTNCIAKAFFGFKNYIKCSKFAETILKIICKLSFRSIKYENVKQQQNQSRLQRFLQRKRKQTLFKYYNSIKNSTSFSAQFQYKIQRLRRKKNEELLQIYFSMLSLSYKKRLVQVKKVTNYILQNRTHQFFYKLNENLLQKHFQAQMYLKQIYYIKAMKKQQFFINLKSNYLQCLKKSRIEVKKTKLQIELTKKYAAKALMEWRKFSIRKQSYKLIQRKLKKVKELQQKQKLFKLWNQRLIEKVNQHKKDKLTSNHKLWLNKYYEKLCALQQQENY